MSIKDFQLIVLFTVLVVSGNYAQNNFEKDFFNHYPKETPGGEFRTLQSPNTGTYDVVHSLLDLTVNPAVYYIDGINTTSFIPLSEDFDEMYFDFTTQISVVDVMYDGNSIDFVQFQGDELRVEFPIVLPAGEMQSVEIHYSGQPASSGFGSFAIETQCGEDQVQSMWTLSEPYGAKHWWPCKQTLNDKYDSVDVHITTPAIYRAASNGTLEEEIDNGDGTKSYHWKHRYAIPAYLVAFAVSEYEVYSDWVPLENGDQLEILNYIFPCNVDYAKARTPNTIPIMQFFRDRFGEYPYIEEKYGHCNFGWGGGMEHSTMSFMGGFSHGLIAHELAHQWFGDKITCGSWQDIWLNEGFATYLEGLTYDFGVAPTSWENWKINNQYRATNDPVGSVWVTDTTSVNRIFNGNLSYAKGAYLLHMLRWMMGDEDFFTAIYAYIHDPELVYDYARTPDLQKHLEASSGLNLDEFFNDWLYGGGYPNYEIVWEQSNNNTWVKINQTPSNPLSVDFFNVPVPIYFSGHNQDTTIVLNPDFSGELFNVDVPFIVENVVFDPERWICAKNQVITAIPDIPGNQFRVYPNPASQNLFVDMDINTAIKIEIFDVFGRLLINQQNQPVSPNGHKIDVSNLYPGTYILRVEYDRGTENIQFIVE